MWLANMLAVPWCGRSAGRRRRRRAAHLDAGRVAGEGPPERLFTEPKNQRRQEFLKAVLEH
jgi:ABC-type histidine transport system ATPase subunit